VCTLLEKGVCTVELGGTELETLRTCARGLRARHWRARAARAKKHTSPPTIFYHEFMKIYEFS
jgi:hypothetical protein